MHYLDGTSVSARLTARVNEGDFVENTYIVRLGTVTVTTGFPLPN